jgi:hypothetical protein
MKWMDRIEYVFGNNEDRNLDTDRMGWIGSVT